MQMSFSQLGVLRTASGGLQEAKVKFLLESKILKTRQAPGGLGAIESPLLVT